MKLGPTIKILGPLTEGPPPTVKRVAELERMINALLVELDHVTGELRRSKEIVTCLRVLNAELNNRFPLSQ